MEKKLHLSLAFFLLIICHLPAQVACQIIKDEIFDQKRNAYGVQMINIDPDNQVWTQKMGVGKTPVMLLHGGPGATHEYFENFPEYLDTLKYTIYFYDQLGSYFSDKPDLENLWELDRFVEEVETVRIALGLTNFYLLGHSWGGIVAFHYALKYPENVNALILSNSPCTSFGTFDYRNEVFQKTKKELKVELDRKPTQAELRDKYNEIYRYGLDTVPEVFTRLERHYNRDPKIWESGFFKQKKWTLEEKAKEIQMPTLIIGGEMDFVDPNDFRLLHSAIPDSELVILPNAGHFSMWSVPEAYFKSLDDFITKK
ncbi:MAG: proline iminopeptidase-family hydrolase [Saprospiraceae bacterium]|nr:proline iminopeptidase-family hydrolase [Saprospiraceae bacterium]